MTQSEERRSQCLHSEFIDYPSIDLKGFLCYSAQDLFKYLWDSIYQNWQSNPWVWVIEFKRVENEK